MDEYAQRRRIQQRRKIRRRRKRIRAVLRLICMTVVLVALLVFAKQISKLNLGGLTWAEKSSGIPTGYVNEADTSPDVPVFREGDALREQIHKLAKKDSDYQEIYDHYDEYPESLMLALSNNSEMLDFVKGYLSTEHVASGGLTREECKADIPLLIQWDKRWGYATYGNSDVAISGCAPTCLSMVVVGLTGNTEATPAAVAAYAEEAGYYQKGTGTSWSIMTEGCEHYGIHGQELSLDRNVIMKHLDAGEPIICSMRPGNFTTAGHFIVLVKEVDGKIMVNDPNSKSRSKILWDYDTLEGQIKNLWGFTK